MTAPPAPDARACLAELVADGAALRKWHIEEYQSNPVIDVDMDLALHKARACLSTTSAGTIPPREPTLRMIAAAQEMAYARGMDGDGFTYADSWQAMYDAGREIRR